MPAARALVPSLLGSLLSDLLGEIVQAQVERMEQARDGRPADVSSAVLDLREVGVVGAGSLGEFLLRQALCTPKVPQSPPKSGLGGADRI
jgi:hypothetical protein